MHRWPRPWTTPCHRRWPTTSSKVALIIIILIIQYNIDIIIIVLVFLLEHSWNKKPLCLFHNKKNQLQHCYTHQNFNFSILVEPGKKFGLDLVALNIQRGREHGIPSYNRSKSCCTLSKGWNINTWTTWQSDSSSRSTFWKVILLIKHKYPYSSIRDRQQNNSIFFYRQISF